MQRNRDPHFRHLIRVGLILLAIGAVMTVSLLLASSKPNWLIIFLLIDVLLGWYIYYIVRGSRQ